VAEADVVALLASGATGHLAFAQTKGLGRDVGALLRETLKKWGGKGGGGKDFAQGSLPDAAKVPDALAFTRKLMETP
jgi:alanyl-tRNA synthetase